MNTKKAHVLKTYEFGDKEKPVIVLLPGTSCHWKNSFQEVVPLLEKQFYVACISYDGFDENETSVFPTMLEETEKIEAYILKQFQGRVHCAYGCSLGGSFVGLLIQRQRVHIEHGILGSSDLDQCSERKAKASCRLMVPLLYALLQEKIFSKLVNRCIKTFAKTPYVKKYRICWGLAAMMRVLYQ